MHYSWEEISFYLPLLTFVTSEILPGENEKDFAAIKHLAKHFDVNRRLHIAKSSDGDQVRSLAAQHLLTLPDGREDLRSAVRLAQLVAVAWFGDVQAPLCFRVPC